MAGVEAGAPLMLAIIENVSREKIRVCTNSFEGRSTDVRSFRHLLAALDEATMPTPFSYRPLKLL